MFLQRVLTAVIGIPIVLAALFYGGIAWRFIVLAIVFVGLLEFARMAGPGIYLDYLLVSGLSFILLSYSGITEIKLLLWLVLQLFYYLIRASFTGMHNFSAAFNLLGVLYVALPLSFLVLVREEFGVIWTIFGLVCTWLTDTGAYFGGSRYGKNKLSKISPNKTIEGCLAGILTAILGAVLFALIFAKPVLKLSIFAAFLSICGQLGDLVESALKRERAVKDSGSLLPGHGGILDRFDSLGFVFPALFILLTLFI